MNWNISPEELLPISELRKDMSRVKREFKSGKKNRFLLTDNGKIFAIVMTVESYEQSLPFEDRTWLFPKKDQPEKGVKKALFKGPKYLSEHVDDIYR